jgi:hypothetical protein
VITVDNKQLSLSVFRQLPNLDVLRCFDDEWDQRGDIWGWVNYHPDKCEKLRFDHLHIVWVDGWDLVRWRVDYRPHQPYEMTDAEYAERRNLWNKCVDLYQLFIAV